MSKIFETLYIIIHFTFKHLKQHIPVLNIEIFKIFIALCLFTSNYNQLSQVSGILDMLVRMYFSTTQSFRKLNYEKRKKLKNKCKILWD